MRISDWSSDGALPIYARADIRQRGRDARRRDRVRRELRWRHPLFRRLTGAEPRWSDWPASPAGPAHGRPHRRIRLWHRGDAQRSAQRRSEEHTSELQSLMRISYAVFCLKKKKKQPTLLEGNSTHPNNQYNKL